MSSPLLETLFVYVHESLSQHKQRPFPHPSLWFMEVVVQVYLMRQLFSSGYSIKKHKIKSDHQHRIDDRPEGVKKNDVYQRSGVEGCPYASLSSRSDTRRG